MDVRCERCSTEYEFDDALVSDKGTTVKCMSCGHQFRVARPSALKAPDKWLVRRPDGQELMFVSLRELQKAIAGHQVGKEDHLFRGALRARSLGSIPELQPFFERATRSPKTTARGLGMPTPAPPGAVRPPVPSAPPAGAQALPSMTLTQPFVLNAGGSTRPLGVPPPSSPPSLPSMNEPIAPMTPAAAPTPMPPPIIVATARTHAPARLPPTSTSSRPPAPAKSTPPPPLLKSTPPPVAHRPPPPVANRAPLPPAVAEELPPPEPAGWLQDNGDNGLGSDDASPDHAPSRSSAAPPARVVEASAEGSTTERRTVRTRSVPLDEDDDLPPQRETGLTGWIVAGGVLGLTALFAGTLGRRYLTTLTAPEVPSASAMPSSRTATSPAAVHELLLAAEKASSEGDLEGAKDTLVRANALAPEDAKVLVALARIAAAKADVAWLRLRLLPTSAADARRVATAELGDAAKRARAAADAAHAAAPESIEALRGKLDALRLSDDLAGARALTGRVQASASSPETALVLGALDLASDEVPTASTLERLRVASATDGGNGRGRALLVYALARAGDPEQASKELDKLAAAARPHPLLPELRALVSSTKPALSASAAAALSGSASAVPIGKLPTVVPGPYPKPESGPGGGYKVNDTPIATAQPTAGTSTAVPTPAPTAPATTAAPTAKPPAPKPPGKAGEFSEDELHRKLFGDQPK